MRAALSVGDLSLSCLAESFGEDGIEASGALIPAARGGTSYQVTSREEEPLSVRQAISVDLVVIQEADYFAMRSVLALAARGPVDLWVDAPIVETWVIATGRTSWALRRSTAVDLAPIATFAPRAFVGSTELTLVSTSPPAAGEFYVEPSARALSIETATLAANVGEVLTLRYYPIRPIGAVEVSWGHADEDVGMWTASIAAEEHLP